MAIKRFSGDFRARTDILDNITPNNVVQPNVAVPAGEWKPAAWLPVQWQGDASKDYFVIASGKVVAFDPVGRVVPAGLRLAAEVMHRDLGLAVNLGGHGADDAVAVAATWFSYTANDVSAKTEDIRTGKAVTAARTISFKEGAQAVLERGFVLEEEADFLRDNPQMGDPVDLDDPDDVCYVLQAFISRPIGVAAYDVYAWAGDAPGELNHVNYQKQHLIQFFTECQMQVPLRANATVRRLVANNSGEWVGAGNGQGIHFPDGSRNGDGNWVDKAALDVLKAKLGSPWQDLTFGDNTVAIALPSGMTAAETDRTPLTNVVGTLVTKKVAGPDKIVNLGDYFLDAENNLLFLWENGGNGAPQGTIDYYHYDDIHNAGEAATSGRHVCATLGDLGDSTLGSTDGTIGRVRPGQFVAFDIDSNFRIIPKLQYGPGANNPFDRRNEADDAGEGNDVDYVIGRVLAVHKQPRGLLDRVRTAWEGSSFAKDAQMPGTATKGFTDLITLNNDVVADTVVILNIRVL